MSAAVQRLYAVQEQASDPLTIPAAPVAVPRPDLLDTEAVYRGAVDTANLIGFIRDDGLVSGDLIARTRGNASSPADIKRFTQRCDALTWLARSVDGVVPRKKWQRKTLAAAGLLACLTAPAVAQSDYAAEAVGEAQQPLARPWVRPVADGETPLQAPTTAPHPNMRVYPAPDPQVCVYAGQPYSVGSPLNGRICGYENDGWQQPPDRSHGAAWRAPIEGEPGYVQPAGAK